MTIARSADCTEIITVMTKMVTVCVTAVLVRLIHMRGVKKMTDDTISRAAAIALVEEIESKRLRGEIDLTYAPMIKGINALSSTLPEWIPCSTEMPPTGKDVLVTLVSGIVTNGERWEPQEGKWFLFGGGVNGLDEDVLAWMPLPAPAKIEG